MLTFSSAQSLLSAVPRLAAPPIVAFARAALTVCQKHGGLRDTWARPDEQGAQAADDAAAALAFRLAAEEAAAKKDADEGQGVSGSGKASPSKRASATARSSAAGGGGIGAPNQRRLPGPKTDPEE